MDRTNVFPASQGPGLKRTPPKNVPIVLCWEKNKQTKHKKKCYPRMEAIFFVFFVSRYRNVQTFRRRIHIARGMQNPFDKKRP